MLRRISTIALSTYREAVRARILLGLTGVAFAVALYSLVVGAFTLNEAPRVVSDLGSMAISVFSIAVAVLIGATSLHRELEMKTVLPLLARPLHRHEFIIGKYLGILLVVLVFVMADTGLVLMLGAILGGRSPTLVTAVAVALAAVLAVVAWRSPRARTFGPIPWSGAMLLAGFLLASVTPGERQLMVSSSLLTLLEVAIVAAIAMLFSAFSTPFLTSLLTLMTFIVGRNADNLAKLPEKVFGKVIHDAGVALSKVAPNLHTYVPARPLLTGESPDVDLASYVALAAAQSAGWILGLLALASFVFRRRDFT